MRRVVVGMLLLVAACAEQSKSANDTAAPSPDRGPPAQARAELVQAQNDLDRALGGAEPGGEPGHLGAVPPTGPDCAAACRALESLERAADHLCALSDPSECADAKSRVERARDRVLKTCGACK